MYHNFFKISLAAIILLASSLLIAEPVAFWGVLPEGIEITTFENDLVTHCILDNLIYDREYELGSYGSENIRDLCVYLKDEIGDFFVEDWVLDEETPPTLGIAGKLGKNKGEYILNLYSCRSLSGERLNQEEFRGRSILELLTAIDGSLSGFLAPRGERASVSGPAAHNSLPLGTNFEEFITMRGYDFSSENRIETGTRAKGSAVTLYEENGERGVGIEKWTGTGKLEDEEWKWEDINYMELLYLFPEEGLSAVRVSLYRQNVNEGVKDHLSSDLYAFRNYYFHILPAYPELRSISGEEKSVDLDQTPDMVISDYCIYNLQSSLTDYSTSGTDLISKTVIDEPLSASDPATRREQLRGKSEYREAVATWPNDPEGVALAELTVKQTLPVITFEGPRLKVQYESSISEYYQSSRSQGDQMEISFIEDIHRFTVSAVPNSPDSR